jgi:Cd2+/Zn2+-exporting ATPase
VGCGSAGSDTAIEVADIALMNDKLSLIRFWFVSVKNVTENKTNTIGAIYIEGSFIVLAVLGYGNLVLAIAADVGVTLVVILLSLNLMRFEAK